MRRSYKHLLALASAWAFAGAVIPHITRDPSDVAAANYLLACPTAILLFCWCKADVRERGIVEPPAAGLLVGILGLFGVAYYFFRSMRFWRALGFTALAAIFFYLLNLTESEASSLTTGHLLISG